VSTFVLVTGAWHGGWAWRPVAERLRGAGHEVHTPTMPGLGTGDDPTGLGLSDCVDAVVTFVEQRDLRDVVLVGHSWGGFLLCGAAPRLSDRLARLVFFSAFVPEHGESLMDLVPPPYVELFEGLAKASGNDTITLPFEVWQTAFMQDAGPEAQRIVYELLVPQPLRFFSDPSDQAGFSDLPVPMTYLVGAEDIALPPGDFAWAPRFPARLKDAVVAETPGSHESLFTRPDDLAASLLKTLD
jgi:pimeloyl-ACP methyl ester carboxylesterase